MNDTTKEALAIVALATGLFAIGLYLGYAEGINATKQAQNEPVIVWNDDIESLPTDGSVIKIEQTVNDTIYIGPIWK